MKKTDQNILWGVALVIIAITTWTLSRFLSATAPASPTTPVTDPPQPAADTTTQPTPPARTIPTISHQNFALALQQRTAPAIPVDLRALTAYDAEHIPGSLTRDTFDPTRTGRHIVLITETGAEDNDLLAQFHTIATDNTIAVLDGGIAAWRDAGKPLVSLVAQPDFFTAVKVHFVEPRDAHTVITNTAQDPVKAPLVIDTRRPGNFAAGHVPGAINIPITELEFRYRDIPAATPIIVYGATDLASFQSGVLLHDLNFFSVDTIHGGWEAWQQYGYPAATD